MAEREPGAGEQSDYTPNFEMFYRDVIHEDNWSEYAALGFEPLLPNLGQVAWRKAGVDIIRDTFTYFGIYNVYTGHVWYKAAGRPASDGPGVGLYVSPAGLQHKADFPRQYIADFLGQDAAYEHEIPLEPKAVIQNLLKRNLNAIHANNWTEYAAKGFMPIADQKHLTLSRLLGISNFYTGEPWDEMTGRPSQSAEGTSIYTSPAGLQHMAEMLSKDRENQRLIHQIRGQTDDRPATS